MAPSGVPASSLTHPLVTAVRAELAALADPVKAPEMRRYMKSELPFHGVPASARRRLGARLFTEHPLPDVDALRAVGRQLWDEAGYREERYLTIDLTGHRAYRPWQTPDLLPLYRDLIVDGAWWDYVDDLAIHRVGPILRGDPEVVAPTIRGWSTGPDLWLRRTSVICQVGAKSATGTALLRECVEANLDDRDFFLRKGIGWGLRDYARTDPDWVRRFVAEHPGLSPLSRREALRHIGT